MANTNIWTVLCNKEEAQQIIGPHVPHPCTHCVRKWVHFQLGCCSPSFTAGVLAAINLTVNLRWGRIGGTVLRLCVNTWIVSVHLSRVTLLSDWTERQAVCVCMHEEDRPADQASGGIADVTARRSVRGRRREGETLTRAVQPATSPAAVGPVWQGQREGQLRQTSLTYTHSQLRSVLWGQSCYKREKKVWLSLFNAAKDFVRFCYVRK